MKKKASRPGPKSSKIQKNNSDEPKPASDEEDAGENESGKRTSTRNSRGKALRNVRIVKKAEEKENDVDKSDEDSSTENTKVNQGKKKAKKSAKATEVSQSDSEDEKPKAKRSKGSKETKRSKKHEESDDNDSESENASKSESDEESKSDSDSESEKLDTRRTKAKPGPKSSKVGRLAINLKITNIGRENGTKGNYIVSSSSPKAKPVKIANKAKQKITKDVDSDDSESAEFEVDKIVDVYFKRDGSREFLVRWKGYKKGDDTWEPEERMNCKELIDKFMEKVEGARQFEAKDLRVRRPAPERLTLVMHEHERRMNRRNKGKVVHYYED